jgi:hypothetical protein
LELGFELETTSSPAFWQRRFHDFNVWSEKKVKEKLVYILFDTRRMNRREERFLSAQANNFAGAKLEEKVGLLRSK